MEVPRKLHGCYDRRRRFPVQCVGWGYDHEDLRKHPEKYINQGRFQHGLNEEKAVHWRSVLSASVCMQAQPSSTLSHSTHTYISGNKRNKKRSRLCLYTSTLLSFSAVHHYRKTNRLNLSCSDYNSIVQSAGTKECADCISAEGVRTHWRVSWI